MKKIHILTVSIFLMLEANFVLIASVQDNNSNIVQNIEISEKTISTQVNSCQAYELDELDSLSQQAEDNGVKIEPLAKPTYLMSIARTLGVLLFLKPYIIAVDNYRIIKKFVIKYAAMAWEAIVGKEPETVTDENKQK